MSRRKSNSECICTVNVHTDNLHRSETKLAVILFLPACLVVMAVLIFPLLYNLWMSLHDVQLANIGEKARFVFFNNYVEVLRESDFLPSLKTSWIGNSILKHQTRPGAQTSPMFGPRKDGSILRSLWTCIPARLLDGPWSPG